MSSCTTASGAALAGIFPALALVVVLALLPDDPVVAGGFNKASAVWKKSAPGVRGRGGIPVCMRAVPDNLAPQLIVGQSIMASSVRVCFVAQCMLSLLWVIVD